jgi:hypothetical protein
VRRSQFDEILFRRAARAGAQAIEGCRAREVVFLPDAAGVQVHATREDGSSESWHARFLVDASGRDTFLGTRLKAKRRNTKHNSAALYGHFRGARRYTEEKRAGDISIYWFDHGWFWFIPLADGTTSVGAVVWPYYTKTRTVPVREFFLATISLCAPLAERLRDAELVADVTATGNYSYACDHAYGTNYLLLGPHVLLRCHAGHEQRRRGRRHDRSMPAHTGARACGPARLRAPDAPRPQSLFVVHLSRHQSDHARYVHGSEQYAAHEGGDARVVGR